MRAIWIIFECVIASSKSLVSKWENFISLYTFKLLSYTTMRNSYRGSNRSNKSDRAYNKLVFLMGDIKSGRKTEIFFLYYFFRRFFLITTSTTTTNNSNILLASRRGFIKGWYYSDMKVKIIN